MLTLGQVCNFIGSSGFRKCEEKHRSATTMWDSSVLLERSGDPESGRGKRIIWVLSIILASGKFSTPWASVGVVKPFLSTPIGPPFCSSECCLLQCAKATSTDAGPDPEITVVWRCVHRFC
ncbi:hypothetical protein ILYODFUR_001609 [Ilyodon furcidens]|uniref:Uncharacterized protein n=1 Tax=Ilyodon furcidens TaxID=33524 RepID=A0ABV0VBU7_9TELE